MQQISYSIETVNPELQKILNKPIREEEILKTDKLLAEQGFQQAGCTTEECAVEMGKLLNVHLVVIGSCGKLLSRFIINIDIVDIETGKFIYSDKDDCYAEREIEDAVLRLVQRTAEFFKNK